LAHNLLHHGRNLVPATIAADAAQLCCMALDDAGAGISVLEDSVTEAHDSALARECLPYPSLGLVRMADFDKHLGDGFVRSAMQGSLERPDRRGDRREETFHCRCRKP